MNPHRTRVSFIPPAPDLRANGLFEGRRGLGNAHSPNTHWMDCFVAARRQALESDMELGTDDVIPVEQADVVVYMAPPESPRQLAALRRRHPRVKLVFVLIETSLGARYTFNPRNHREFDAVLTYKEDLVDDRKYFAMRPRAYRRDRIRTGLPFEDRRVGCLVGTHRKMRFRSGLFTMRAGWRFSVRDWIDYAFCPGELITYRGEVGKACARFGPGTFDIFGEGWESIPETRPLFRGVPEGSTLSYLGNYRYTFAFENHSAKDGLISERIWDALWADTVPVYRGNPNLGRFVPRDCFIDAADFGSPAEMLRSIHDMPRRDWMRYRDAGRAFIQGTAVEQFLPEAVAAELLRPLRALTGQTPAPERDG